MRHLFSSFMLLSCGVAAAQSGPSYDNGPAIIALVSPTGSSPYGALTTTGTAGPSYDYAATALILGFNSTANKYYVCGTANPCTGSGSSSGGTVTLAGDVMGSSSSNTVVAVHATSGTLNGTTIGGTTPAPGTFSVLSQISSSSYVVGVQVTNTQSNNTQAFSVLGTGYSGHSACGGVFSQSANANEIVFCPSGNSGGTSIGGSSVGQYSGYGWTSGTEPGASTLDTAFSRVSAGVVALGNGTQGDTTGQLRVGAIIPTPSSPSSGSVTCTANALWHDDAYVYACNAAGTAIKRAALSSF